MPDKIITIKRKYGYSKMPSLRLKNNWKESRWNTYSIDNFNFEEHHEEVVVDSLYAGDIDIRLDLNNPTSYKNVIHEIFRYSLSNSDNTITEKKSYLSIYTYWRFLKWYNVRGERCSKLSNSFRFRCKITFK